MVDVGAAGDTKGLTLSGGLSAGYDFLLGGLTVSPNLGFFYIDATIDGFTESGAGGLNLIYDEQKFKSLTGNLGLRLTYAWNLPWGVLLPHLRIDYVREFEDDVDVFGVRFASDPNATSTPPILVETENPDTLVLAPRDWLLNAVQIWRFGVHRVSATREFRIHLLPGHQRRIADAKALLIASVPELMRSHPSTCTGGPGTRGAGPDDAARNDCSCIHNSDLGLALARAVRVGRRACCLLRADLRGVRRWPQCAVAHEPRMDGRLAARRACFVANERAACRAASDGLEIVRGGVRRLVDRPAHLGLEDAG